MAIIKINNIEINNVRMHLEPFFNVSTAYLQYPENVYKTKETENGFNLWIPSYVVIELFHQKILKKKNFDLEIDGEYKGRYYIKEIRYPNDTESIYNRIRLNIVRSKVKAE